MIGNTRTIKAENKVPMSVITSHAYISIDQKSKMQEGKAYCTSDWLFHIPTEEQSGHFLETSEDQDCYFRLIRNAFIKERLKVVNEEQDTQKMKDFVDEIV